MNSFTLKIYRVEWVVVIYAVTDLGAPCYTEPFYYQCAHATREEAEADLKRVSVPHPYVQGRRVALKEYCTHSYHECEIRYREVLHALSEGESLGNGFVAVRE